MREIDIVPNLPLICGCHRWIVGRNRGVGREAWSVIGGLATSGSSDSAQRKKMIFLFVQIILSEKKRFFMTPQSVAPPNWAMSIGEPKLLPKN